MITRTCKHEDTCRPNRDDSWAPYLPCGAYLQCSCSHAAIFGPDHCHTCGHQADCHDITVYTTQVPVLAVGKLV